MLMEKILIIILKLTEYKQPLKIFIFVLFLFAFAPVDRIADNVLHKRPVADVIT